MASIPVGTVTDSTFDADVLKSKVPVLVAFWTDWSGACQKYVPYLDRIATDYSGKVPVLKLDVDSSTVTAIHYHVTSVPTLIVFKAGKAMDVFLYPTFLPPIRAALDRALL